MNRTIKVRNPFSDMTKSQMVKWYINHVGDITSLKKTVGCFDRANGHCGACASCFRRSIAFAANKIPLDNQNIKKWSGIHDYIDKLKAGQYEPERTKETLDVLKTWGWHV
jgi:hypothetical protein